MAIINEIYLEVLAFVLGSIISFVMSWYFYKKADFPSKVSSAMIEDIFKMFIQDRIGVDFVVQEYTPQDELPKDTDVPHITQFWLSKESVKPGESLVILFRVNDTGLNFPVDLPVRSGLDVTELSSGISFPTKREGHAYYSCRIEFPANAIPGQHNITVKLKDRKGNNNMHTMKVKVEN